MTEVDSDVQLVLDDLKRRTGNRPNLLGRDTQEALLAASIMSLMSLRYCWAKANPEKYPMTEYVDIYSKCHDILWRE